MASRKSVPDFALEVSGVKGLCPAGETYAEKNMSKGKIPVISCEAPCIRGEIARLAANMVAVEEPFARCCHAESFTVPNSSMARWVKESAKVVMKTKAQMDASNCRINVFRGLSGVQS